MESAKTSLFQLPQATVVETVYVQLADGRIVPRSPEELAALPDADRPTIIAQSQT
jgi:hypothetical protein